MAMKCLRKKQNNFGQLHLKPTTDSDTTWNNIHQRAWHIDVITQLVSSPPVFLSLLMQPTKSAPPSYRAPGLCAVRPSTFHSSCKPIGIIIDALLRKGGRSVVQNCALLSCIVCYSSQPTTVVYFSLSPDSSCL